MRRRKQKNPLLARIIGVSVAVHIVALPILAHFGAFKKIRREFVNAQMVVLPPAEKLKQKEVKAARKAASPRKVAAAGRARSSAARSNYSQPKVVASASAGPADSGGPTVDANASGKAGVLPTVISKGAGGAGTGSQPAVQPTAPVVAPVAPRPAPAPVPAPAPAPAPAVAPRPAAPHAPVLADAVPTVAPEPAIPDDLRSEALDKTFVAEFSVGADGLPTAVKVSQSTGNQELDDLALDAAKRWRFKPATRDGSPVESVVRLHIQFQVS